MRKLVEIDRLNVESSFNDCNELYMFIVEGGSWSEVDLTKSQVEKLRDHLNKVLEKFDEKGED